MVLLRVFLLAVIVAITGSQAQPERYVGSTTCNAELREALKIPESINCEFIKWELELNSAARTFVLHVRYGEGQPNTNGFKNGGFVFDMDGQFSTTTGAESNQNYAVIHLKANLLASELTLVRMNEDILHFANQKTELLVGNGGFGCALNKLK